MHLYAIYLLNMTKAVNKSFKFGVGVALKLQEWYNPLRKKQGVAKMKAVVQRVTWASVCVDGETVGRIDKGYMVLLGVGEGDTRSDCDRLAAKLVKLRIFEDENGKTNLSIVDVGGEMLIVSQFTLYADCSHGNRPSFVNAAKPDLANELYVYFCEKVRLAGINVQKGIFGADMKVELLNDGPFTVVLEGV